MTNWVKGIYKKEMSNRFRCEVDIGGLEIKIRKAKKYCSYKGEISPSVPNEVQRNFFSEKPNELLLSDISEFVIPEGKVYLSPTVDCFDGMLITWRISEPIIHTDRGCHYRWPGWIKRMEINGYTRPISRKRVFSR